MVVFVIGRRAGSDVGSCDEVFQRVFGASAVGGDGDRVHLKRRVFSVCDEAVAAGHSLRHVDRVWNHRNHDPRRAAVRGQDVATPGDLRTFDHLRNCGIEAFGRGVGQPTSRFFYILGDTVLLRASQLQL